MTAVSIAQAAAELGLSPRQVRTLVAKGAPVIRRGGRGHGNATLLDPRELRRWLSTREDARVVPAAPLDSNIAHGLVRAIAAAVVHEFRLETGPEKMRLLPRTLTDFFTAANAVRRQFGLQDLAIEDAPPEIKQMAQLVLFDRRR